MLVTWAFIPQGWDNRSIVDLCPRPSWSPFSMGKPRRATFRHTSKYKVLFLALIRSNSQKINLTNIIDDYFINKFVAAADFEPICSCLSRTICRPTKEILSTKWSANIEPSPFWQNDEKIIPLSPSWLLTCNSFGVRFAQKKSVLLCLGRQLNI